MEKLTAEQIDQLFLIKHRKKIKNKELAAMVGYSETHISRFFNHDGTLSYEAEQLVKRTIEEA
ncbi:hypothetical protein ACTXGU_00080 [Niallia sp. 01092]|uniref:hypothetical protein n=1 Tax=Niallia sp. 01092 TaxID=3457759 RepID=UPI003FD584DF